MKKKNPLQPEARKPFRRMLRGFGWDNYPFGSAEKRKRVSYILVETEGYDDSGFRLCRTTRKDK